MAGARSYKMRGIVLKKTKLAEKDLIVTLLDESGAMVRAVAKGARKPGGSLAARIELFSVVDLMLYKGRNLDVVTEATFARGRPASPMGVEQSSCAAVVAELLCSVCEEGLSQPRLYDMTVAALDAIADSDARDALCVTAADLLKTLSLAGFRPALDRCVACGQEIDGVAEQSLVPISVQDGGAFCERCRRPADCILVPCEVLAWSRAMIGARFGYLRSLGVDLDTSLAVLQFARQWACVHTGRDLKSLDFLFTAGLF